jgi:hypothetical protein
MRILGACCLGGAGHFNPLVAFLHAACRRGDEVLTSEDHELRGKGQAWIETMSLATASGSNTPAQTGSDRGGKDKRGSVPIAIDEDVRQD